MKAGKNNTMINPMMLMMTMQQMKQTMSKHPAAATAASRGDLIKINPFIDDEIDPDVQELCVPWVQLDDVLRDHF